MGDEKINWEKSIIVYTKKCNQVVGDILLACGYMSYMGPFSGKYRRETITQWKGFVKQEEMGYDENFKFVDVMGNDVEIMKWIQISLPNDDLSKENVIMKKLSDR